MVNQIVIDGSSGEGGGQVLRISLSLASLLQCPVEVHHIRANRSKPGLRPQHLAAVRALARITGAEVTGDQENSTSLKFWPGAVKAGKYRFRIGTAGSVTLLASSILPPLLFAQAPSTVVLEGGTHVPYSPVFQYMQEVFLPFLLRMGGEVDAILDSWGWYPEGGGICTLRIVPCRGLECLRVAQRGRLRNLDLMLGLAGLPAHITDREENHVRSRLAEMGYDLARRFEAAPSPGQGNVLFLKGEYDHTLAGFSALGKRGRPAERVAEDLCRQWLSFERSPGAVDRHLADQLLIYMALARGESLLAAEEITSHLLTGAGIIEQFLPVRFRLDPGTRTVAVAGTAFEPVGKSRPRFP